MMAFDESEGFYPLARAPQDRPLNDTWSTGYSELDPYWKLYATQFTVVTGRSGSGKSTFLFNVLLRMAIEDGHKCALWVPENEGQIVANFTRLWPASEHLNGLSYFLHEQAFIQSARSRYFTDEPMDIVAILQRVGDHIETCGIDVVMLDPWNELESCKPRDQLESEYIGDVLRLVKHWTRQFKVATILVAHPTKAPVDQDRVPRLYDISGSANWANKADNGLIVSRYPDRPACRVISDKVREIGAGSIGQVEFNVDPLTGVFTPICEGVPYVDPGNKKAPHRSNPGGGMPFGGQSAG